MNGDNFNGKKPFQQLFMKPITLRDLYNLCGSMRECVPKYVIYGVTFRGERYSVR